MLGPGECANHCQFSSQATTARQGRPWRITRASRTSPGSTTTCSAASEEPYHLVRQLVGALAPGSYVVISHAAADIGNGDMASMTSRLNELMAQQSTPRNRAQVGQFFEGLNLVEPGLVRVPEWRPAMAIDAKAPAQMWAGVALKQ